MIEYEYKINLMEYFRDYNILYDTPFAYFPYRESGHKLQENITDEEEYHRITVLYKGVFRYRIYSEEHQSIITCTDLVFTDATGRQYTTNTFGCNKEGMLCILPAEKKWRKFFKNQSLLKKNVSQIFIPGMSVLVRNDDTEKWQLCRFEKYLGNLPFSYLTDKGLYAQCIPYNKMTEKYLNKNNKPNFNYIWVIKDKKNQK